MVALGNGSWWVFDGDIGFTVIEVTGAFWEG